MGSRRVLVTGGTGFIGAKLVENLLEASYKPVVFDNNFRGLKHRLKLIQDKIELIEGDIRDKDSVIEAMKGCDTVFHLAFINGTRYFYENPELVLEVGIKGAINTIEAALENNVNKYILASSSEVYQQPTHLPTTEEERIIIPDIKNPRYSYAGGKIISELLTINYLRKSSIKHYIFRPHNVFGPQMGFEHVIPELLRKICLASENYTKKECTIEIQGSGKESRAFCYLDDAIEQIMIVFNKGKNGEIYHVGIDEEITILQLIDDISQALDIKIKIVPGKLKQGGTSRRCPSINKICSLGYVKKNSYTEGLKKSVDWYKNYFKNEIYQK